MVRVIKRNGEMVDFDKSKIYKAIMKAMKYGSGLVDAEFASYISTNIQGVANNTTKNLSISDIESLVFDMLSQKYPHTARAYENYRTIREYQREVKDTDDSILNIVYGTNTEVNQENSNKNPRIICTQRDYIAGEVSKDLSMRKKIPAHLLQAHINGIIHLHDLDYFIQDSFNCCLINLKDMLDNGTVINGKMIETPKSFNTACTIATQIVHQVAGSQYGGCTISLAHLAPYVRVSRDKIRRKAEKRITEAYKDAIHEGLAATKEIQKFIDMLIDREVKEQLADEIKDGIQTIQYQISTFSTQNGFVTLAVVKSC